MQYPRWRRGQVAEPVYSIRNLVGKEENMVEKNVLFNDAVSCCLCIVSVINERGMSRERRWYDTVEKTNN